ncbi:MAG: AAA family ATPase [Spirochaetaceae bacterium]|jgi:exonuclease SbcC|nr:AAA family ATPase [Spirochaetaceae bacterium]
MKILNLALKNINSLAGEWKIDFTDTAFNNGLFILHGATGAGKTSILDALCLALYGKTSRQNSFSKTQNEVMANGTSSCFAQVEFEAGGEQYRSYWEHKKTKNGIAFQGGCTRRFYRLGSGETVLAEKIGEVNEKIVSVLGMDFDQFTSAVLLPQGKFDSFLTAEKKQRSEILEKISRTQIYSKIGAAVHRRRNDEYDKLDSLKDKIEEIIVASQTEESALREKIIKCKILLEEKKAEAVRADIQLRLYEEHNKLQNEINILDNRIDDLKRTAKNEKERFARLDQAKKAGAIADTVLQFDQTKNEKERLESEIQKIKIDLEGTRKICAELLPQKNDAEMENEAAGKDMAENEPNIKKAREIDVRIHETENNISDKRKKIQYLAKINDELGADLAAASEKNIKLQESLNGLKTKMAGLKEETAKNRAIYDDIGESIRSLSVFSSTASFEENRKSLRGGEPCPLCGSVEHPFCDDQAGLIENQAKLKSMQMESVKLKRAIAEAERALEKFENEKSRAEAELSGFAAKTAANQTALKSNNEQERTLRDEAEICEKQTAELKACRAALVAVKDIDQFERSLKERQVTSAANLAKIDKRLSDYTRDTENHERLLAEKDGQYRILLLTFEQKQNSMEAAFARQGFDSHKTWSEFNWGAEKIMETEQAKARLEAELKSTEAQKTKLTDTLLQLPPLPDRKYEDIELERHNISAAIEETNKEIGGMEKQLEINDHNKRRRATFEKEIGAQTEICGRWKWMDDWVGGADGWKFKNYVQALTLKSLIHNANAYFLSMSSQRYMMFCRESTDELLPVVVDRHQGSIERSITNLSGGERFMLSLSLALGLSKLNSSKLSIDSLFLDEGFGTLDKESLELTINILNGLKQHQGKLTGIISHVEELHEHITACIEVIKTGGGRSRLSGCGVSRLT